MHVRETWVSWLLRTLQCSGHTAADAFQRIAAAVLPVEISDSWTRLLFEKFTNIYPGASSSGHVVAWVQRATLAAPREPDRKRRNGEGVVSPFRSVSLLEEWRAIRGVSTVGRGGRLAESHQSLCPIEDGGNTIASYPLRIKGGRDEPISNAPSARRGHLSPKASTTRSAR
jgi:hypothetical protein